MNTKGSQINKICNTCKKVHEIIPENAREWLDGDEANIVLGFFWECDCKSTMFSPVYSISKTLKKVSGDS